MKSSNVLSNWIVLPTERGWGWLFVKQLSVNWEERLECIPRKAKEVLFGLPCLSDREIVNSDVSQISHVLSRRDRLRLETTRPSDPRTETILRQLKGMGNDLSAPRKAKKTVVLGLDVNFTKRERERILREWNYQLAFWVIMGHGGKQVSEKSRSELRHVVVEKKEAWGIFEYLGFIRRALFAFHDLDGQTGG